MTRTKRPIKKTIRDPDGRSHLHSDGVTGLRPPWRIGPHKDRIRAGAGPGHPWPTALITGASSGIGEALARQLAGQGVRVILAARRVTLIKGIASEIRGAGGKATAVQLDVANATATVKMLVTLDKKFGGIDLVVANAGVGVERSAAYSWSWPAIRETLQINYTGAIATITALLPHMVARGKGHVVAISSLASYGPLPDAAGYSSPKAGLSRFMECLALDLQGTGVVTSTVHVGFVATPMVAKSTIPLPFLMSTDKAARHIIFKLRKGRREINFPFAMVIFVRIIAALPYAFKAWVARRYYRQKQ